MTERFFFSPFTCARLHGLITDHSSAVWITGGRFCCYLWSPCNTTQTDTVTVQLLALSKQSPLSYENITKVYALRKRTMQLRQIS